MKTIFKLILIFLGCPNTSDGRVNICQLPADSGPCSGFFRQYHYDAKANDCIFFTYGGCKGNGNRFRSKHRCLDSCKYAPHKNTAAVKFHWLLHTIDEEGNTYYNKFAEEAKMRRRPRHRA